MTWEDLLIILNAKQGRKEDLSGRVLFKMDDGLYFVDIMESLTTQSIVLTLDSEGEDET